jgi:hypothetical protein
MRFCQRHGQTQGLPCLVRNPPVPKSAFQSPGERPDAQRDFETIDATELSLVGERVTLVDDFVTTENTLVGAVMAATLTPRLSFGARRSPPRISRRR